MIYIESEREEREGERERERERENERLGSHPLVFCSYISLPEKIIWVRLEGRDRDR